MPRFLKIFIGILGIVLIAAVTVIVLGIRIVKKSLPQTAGTLTVSGLQSPVKIYRDAFGVPHIFAQNEADLLFAMGYVVSQDRLWQMELNRRAATGTLAEIFGSRAIEIDQFIRTIGIPKIANELTQKISSESRSILTAYAAGVNAYLAQNKNHLSNEFVLMQSQFQPWKIEHSLAYQRFIAWGLEMAWRVDPLYGELVDRIGSEKTTEILPIYPANAPTIVEDQSIQFRGLQNSFNKIAHDLSDLIKMNVTGLGSNSWVLSGERTTTGKPLLANDPHLMHQNPSIWYEVHLKAPGIDCYGVALPGCPGIVIGHNQAIAWGLTNVMADGCDFFVEKINPENSNQYWYQEKWNEMTKTTEVISVKDQPSVTFDIRFTQQGPIISDIHPTIKDSSKSVSLKWTGYQPSDETLACNKINKARTWNEFLEGLKYFAVPAQNYIYADNQGNIGYHCAGSIPIRRKGTGLMPQPGWNRDFDWMTFIPFEQLPHSFNPFKGMIVTANNKIDDDSYPHFISNYWEPPYRAQRINELLTKKNKLSIDDFKVIQSDQFSKHAQFLMPTILKALPEFKQDTQLKTYVCHCLQTWDLKLSTESVAPTIFEIFLIQFYKNIFQDELGDTLISDFLELPSIPIRVTDNLISQETSDWFDNIKTPDIKETLPDIVLTSLEETIDYIRSNFGETVYQWRWGKIHTVTFEHMLGQKNPVNRLFNIGPFPLGGSYCSVNNATFLINRNDFRAVSGPSMRQIVDLSKRNNSLSVITTGQCGNPLSQHFKDQTPLWLNGAYHKAITDSTEICSSEFDLLILKPF